MARKEINLLSILKSAVHFFNENPMYLNGKPVLQAAVYSLKALIVEIEPATNDTFLPENGRCCKRV